MPTIRSLCGILPLPSLLVRARAPKQLFGLKEDTGTGPRSPSGFTSGTHGLSSSDGRLLLNRPFAHSPRSPRHKGQGEGLFPTFESRPSFRHARIAIQADLASVRALSLTPREFRIYAQIGNGGRSDRLSRARRGNAAGKEREKRRLRAAQPVWRGV